MLKRLAALTVLAVGSFSIANAATFSGFFSANGNDQFTSSSITFFGAQVSGAIGGDFATYLTPGTSTTLGSPIVFLPGALPYHNGMNTPPNPPFTTGSAPLYQAFGSGGEVFTFNMTGYDAGLITDGSNGCVVGGTCLDVTGTGFFTATGPLSGTSGPATFVFTSQYAPGATVASMTTFSASTSATGQPPIPEPASLALVGSGLLSAFGLIRRRLTA